MAQVVDDSAALDPADTDDQEVVPQVRGDEGHACSERGPWEHPASGSGRDVVVGAVVLDLDDEWSCRRYSS